MHERDYEMRLEREPSPELSPQLDANSWSLRSDDGRAEMVLTRQEDGTSEIRHFRTERSDRGTDSAHVLMDQAQVSAVRPPAELSPSLAPHPDFVDLLRDEPGSVRFWSDRTTHDFADADRNEALDIARQMVYDSERRPEFTALEPPERWIGDVNAPGTSATGRGFNDVFCGAATEARWRGINARAGEWPHQRRVSRDTTEEIVGPLRETTPADIEHTLLAAGPGSSGIVAVDRPGGGDHVVNVVNDRGTLKWLDGQAGTVEARPPTASVFRWNGRDPDGRRL